MNIVNFAPLWSHPLVFRHIRRVDHEFGYLYQNGIYTPLKRNCGWHSFMFPWLKMGVILFDRIRWQNRYKQYSFSNVDELSHFFAMFVDEDVDNYEIGSTQAWDELFVDPAKEQSRFAKINKAKNKKAFEKLNNYGKQISEDLIKHREVVNQLEQLYKK